MNRLVWTWTAALTLAAMGAAELARNEPTYKNKSVTEWVAALEAPQSAAARPKQVEAEEAIHELGPEAIPFILQYRGGTRAQRLELIGHACALLQPESDLKLLDALRSSDAAVRETALEVLPKSVLPAAMGDLVQSSEDPVRSVRTAAILAMVRLAPDQPETMAALIQALHGQNESSASGETQFSRQDAALALGKLGHKAAAASPELMALLTDSNDDTREAAATALWKIEKNAQTVPVLVECLEDARDYQVCIRVMTTLAEMGPAAKAAVPVITRKIENPGVSFVPPNVDFAKIAVGALTRIDPSAGAEARKKLQPAAAEKE